MREKQPQQQDNSNGSLEFEERVYRSFPAPLMYKLLHAKGVGKPTAIVESVEASTGIPAFEPEEFDLLMQDLEADAAEATKQLEELVAKNRERLET